MSWHFLPLSLIRCKSFILAVLLAFSPSPAGADLWMIDFNSNQDQGGDSSGFSPKNSVANHNQSGWLSYHANHEVIAEFTSETYGTLVVTPDWPNTTNLNVRQSIDRNNQDDNPPYQAVVGANDATWNNAFGDINLVTDFIGIDTRTGNGGNGNWDGITGTPTYMTLTLSGLAPGIYDWTSFHHDTENVHGYFSVELSLDSGANYLQLPDGYMSDGTTVGTPDSALGGFPGPQSGPDAFSLISTYRTSFIADGINDVVFRFAPYSNTGVHRQIWGMNGFVLELVPEPTTALLVLLALGGANLRRRR